MIASGASIAFGAQTLPSGEIQTTFTLLAGEPFRSLAVSLRLVYMDGEPANYYHICNLLHRITEGEARQQVANCRARYKHALEGTYVTFNLHGDFEGQVAGPTEIFEAWLYGLAFHQDLERQPLVNELAKYNAGLAFPFAVQMIGLRLAGAILDLDDIIADTLREPRVPRITGSDDATPASQAV